MNKARQALARSSAQQTDKGRIGRWIIPNLALLGGALLSLRGLFQTYSLKAFIPPPSDASRYEERVADLLGPWMFLALGLVVLGTAMLYLGRRLTSKSLLVGTAAISLAVFSIAIALVTGSRLKNMLEPFKSEVAALNSFPAPAEWRGPSAGGRVSFFPKADRIYQITEGSLADACSALEAALNRWADPNTVKSKKPLPNEECLFEATKGPDNVVDVRVYPPGNVTITLVRKEKVTPESLV